MQNFFEFRNVDWLGRAAFWHRHLGISIDLFSTCFGRQKAFRTKQQLCTKFSCLKPSSLSHRVRTQRLKQARKFLIEYLSEASLMKSLKAYFKPFLCGRQWSGKAGAKWFKLGAFSDEGAFRTSKSENSGESPRFCSDNAGFALHRVHSAGQSTLRAPNGIRNAKIKTLVTILWPPVADKCSCRPQTVTPGWPFQVESIRNAELSIVASESSESAFTQRGHPYTGFHPHFLPNHQNFSLKWKNPKHFSAFLWNLDEKSFE